MKRKILLAIALLTCLLIIIRVFNPPQKELDKIFEFRLGMSEKELRKVPNTALLKKIEIIPEKTIHDILSNKNAHYDELVRVGRVKAYYLENYVSTDNYHIKDLELYFFDDKLYRVKIKKYDPIIEEWLNKKEAAILNEKYENPPVDEEMPEIEEYGWWQGEKRKITSRTSSSQWSTNNTNIECRSHCSMKTDYTITKYYLILVDKRREWIAKYKDISEEEKEQKDIIELERQRIEDKYFR